MLKVFYSSFGDREALQVQLDEIRADLARRYEGLIAALEPMTEGVHPFPEREHMTNLLIRHFMKSLDARLAWLEEVESLLGSWPDTQIDDERRAEARANSAALLAHARAKRAELEDA